MSALPMTARRGLFGLVGAAALTGVVLPKVGPTDTPVAAFHRRYRQVEAEWGRLDSAAFEARRTVDEERLENAREIKFEELMDLQMEAKDHQALTVEDAVIQAVIAFYMAESFTIRREEEADHQAVMTLLASVIQCLAGISGIDLDRVGHGEMAHLCALRGPGGENAA